MKHYTESTDENGTRYATGDGGGRIVFEASGKVRVLWVWTAALAADHGSGKRNDKARFTTARKGLPPAESEALRHVLDCRADAEAFALSGDCRDQESREFLDIHRPLAWRMLHAVATGDAETLRGIAEAVEIAQYRLNASPWAQIAEAIRVVAERKNDIPTRAEVLDRYNRATVNNQTDDLRDRLARMGFGWLPARTGRPSKKVK